MVENKKGAIKVDLYAIHKDGMLYHASTTQNVPFYATKKGAFGVIRRLTTEKALPEKMFFYGTDEEKSRYLHHLRGRFTVVRYEVTEGEVCFSEEDSDLEAL